nr:hypothetical protein [Candidatus Sigynarchaeota archaeon]
MTPTYNTIEHTFTKQELQSMISHYDGWNYIHFPMRVPGLSWGEYDDSPVYFSGPSSLYYEGDPWMMPPSDPDNDAKGNSWDGSPDVYEGLYGPTYIVIGSLYFTLDSGEIIDLMNAGETGAHSVECGSSMSVQLPPGAEARIDSLRVDAFLNTKVGIHMDGATYSDADIHSPIDFDSDPQPEFLTPGRIRRPKVRVNGFSASGYVGVWKDGGYDYTIVTGVTADIVDSNLVRVSFNLCPDPGGTVFDSRIYVDVRMVITMCVQLISGGCSLPLDLHSFRMADLDVSLSSVIQKIETTVQTKTGSPFNRISDPVSEHQLVLGYSPVALGIESLDVSKVRKIWLDADIVPDVRYIGRADQTSTSEAATIRNSMQYSVGVDIFSFDSNSWYAIAGTLMTGISCIDGTEMEIGGSGWFDLAIDDDGVPGTDYYAPGFNVQVAIETSLDGMVDTDWFFDQTEGIKFRLTVRFKWASPDSYNTGNAGKLKRTSITAFDPLASIQFLKQPRPIPDGYITGVGSAFSLSQTTLI